MQHNRIDTHACWQLLKLLPKPPPPAHQQQQQNIVGVVCICTRCLPRACQRAISTCPSSHSELCPEVLRLMCATVCQRSRHRLRFRLKPRGRCQAVGQRLWASPGGPQSSTISGGFTWPMQCLPCRCQRAIPTCPSSPSEFHPKIAVANYAMFCLVCN